MREASQSPAGEHEAPRPAPLGWRLVLVFGLTALILGALISELSSAEQLRRALAGISLEAFALAFALACALVVLGVLRWNFILRAMGHRLSFARGLVALLATWPLVVVTPSRANELLRAWVVRAQVPAVEGAGSILAEKALDLLVLLLFCAGAAALHGMLGWSVGLLVAAAAELALIGALLFRRDALLRWSVFAARRERIDRLLRAFEALARAPLALVAATASSLAIRVGVVGIVHLLLVASGARLSLASTLATWLIAVLVGLLPLTVAGMGTRDASFLFLVRRFGEGEVSDAQLLTASLGYSALAIWSFALIGLPFMVREILRRREGA